MLYIHVINTCYPKDASHKNRRDGEERPIHRSSINTFFLTSALLQKAGMGKRVEGIKWGDCAKHYADVVKLHTSTRFAAAQEGTSAPSRTMNQALFL